MSQYGLTTITHLHRCCKHLFPWEEKTKVKGNASVQVFLMLFHCFVHFLLQSDFLIFSTGQRDSSNSSESRSLRSGGEESNSPKATNGTSIRPASVSTSVCDGKPVFPKLVSEVNQELLTSGAVILPGTEQTLIFTSTHQGPIYCGFHKYWSFFLSCYK